MVMFIRGRHARVGISSTRSKAVARGTNLFPLFFLSKVTKSTRRLGVRVGGGGGGRGWPGRGKEKGRMCATPPSMCSHGQLCKVSPYCNPHAVCIGNVLEGQINAHTARDKETVHLLLLLSVHSAAVTSSFSHSPLPPPPPPSRSSPSLPLPFFSFPLFFLCQST